ncbi:MAG TPA: hypothetical protein VF546_13645 [Pyrinomonadaceae bacterium]|jgi:hypothetical protein
MTRGDAGRTAFRHEAARRAAGRGVARRLLAALAALGLCLLAAAALAQKCPAPGARCRAPQAVPKSSTAKQLLASGLYYYNHDDTCDNAAQFFRALLTPKYRGTEEAESAQYFLASYYQRKFYVKRAQWRCDDWDALKTAQREFKVYTDNYYHAHAQWLGDAFFNLALVNWQLDDKQAARNELTKMRDAAGYDDSVYVYEIIWSLNTEDVVDSSLSTRKLSDCALNNFNQPFDRAVTAMRQWSQGQRKQ